MNRARAFSSSGLAVIGIALFFLMASSADKAAEEIERTAEANENRAESAPQQQVVATWAIRDLAAEQLRQNGIRDGLLAVCALMLGAIAAGQAIPARTTRKQATEHPPPIQAPEPPPPPAEPKKPARAAGTGTRSRSKPKTKET